MLSSMVQREASPGSEDSGHEDDDPIGANLNFGNRNKGGLSDKERRDLAARFYAPEGDEGELRPLSPPRAAPKAAALTPTFSVQLKGDGLAVSYGPDGSMVAFGERRGAVQCLSSEGALTYELPARSTRTGPVPCAAVAFRPIVQGHGTKNVLLAARGSSIELVHVTSGQVLGSADEGEHQTIGCAAWRRDGRQMVTAGADRAVRVYDGETFRPLVCMAGGPGGDDASTAGHSNNIFACMFSPEDPHLLLSGGWDASVQLWDVREGHAVRSIGGPLVCGASLDVREGVVLAGSWRAQRHLQLFDLASGRLLTNLPNVGGEGAKIYAARFGPAGSIVAGSTGPSPELRVLTERGRTLASAPLSEAQGVTAIDYLGLPAAGGQHHKVGVVAGTTAMSIIIQGG